MIRPSRLKREDGYEQSQVSVSSATDKIIQAARRGERESVTASSDVPDCASVEPELAYLTFALLEHGDCWLKITLEAIEDSWTLAEGSARRKISRGECAPRIIRIGQREAGGSCRSSRRE